MLDMFNTCINAALLNLRKHVKQKENIFTSRYPISRGLTNGNINNHRLDALSVMRKNSENKGLYYLYNLLEPRPHSAVHQNRLVMFSQYGMVKLNSSIIVMR